MYRVIDEGDRWHIGALICCRRICTHLGKPMCMSARGCNGALTFHGDLEVCHSGHEHGLALEDCRPASFGRLRNVEERSAAALSLPHVGEGVGFVEQDERVE